MEKIEVTRYVAENGRIFDTEIACIEYENDLHNHKMLISQFEVFDISLNKIEKPQYLWSNDKDKFTEEYYNDPDFKDFDWIRFCKEINYVLFKENTNYKTIKDCFDIMGRYCGRALDFPEKIGKKLIIYLNSEKLCWDNFDDILKKSSEVINTYEFLKTQRKRRK